MSSDADRPLSALVAQGWEIIGFSAGYDHSAGMHGQHVLLRRQKAHKVLHIRKKLMGQGVVVRETDI